ncbi:hypothetical protein DSO57_1022520 [Entomophthora muscae]|uniref:Uncharacterized protein n=1 Tax=Entomophthora muscae TaxID=34485 RepID=A0ACC2S599_9FUNG|nr:hypothetical protein DSO57_1022520 [Entomophthora muscae]
MVPKIVPINWYIPILNRLILDQASAFQRNSPLYPPTQDKNVAKSCFTRVPYINQAVKRYTKTLKIIHQVLLPTSL